MRLSLWVDETKFYQLKRHLDSNGENTIVPEGERFLRLKGTQPKELISYKTEPGPGLVKIRVIITSHKIRFLL